MSRYIRMMGTRVSRRARALDRWLGARPGGRRLWLWSVPLLGFVICAAILVIAGVLSGVWAAEYIPTALFEGLVISGLFFACLAPVTDAPDSDQGDRGPDDGPEPAPPPPFDPTVWVTLLDDPRNAPHADRDAQDAARRETIGAGR
jgi:hypothetical protein